MNFRLFNIKDSALYKYLLRYKRRSGEKTVTFLFFVLLSTIFWLFSTLSGNYTAAISYPVRYKNFPPDKILMDEVPNKVKLEIYASGYTILRYKLRPWLTPISFNVASFLAKNETEDQSSDFYIITSSAKEKVQRQLDDDIRVVAILPDTIFFNFSKLSEKKLKVRPNLETVFEKQYMQRGPIIATPDIINASGPEKILDSIKFVETEFYKFLLIKDTLKRIIKLKPIENITFEPDEIEIIINSEKYTEAELKIPVVTVNVPDSLIMKTFPRNVNITFKIALSDYEKAVPDLFKITADYLETNKQIKQIPLKIEKSPDFVSGIKLNAQRVEYLIER